MLFCACVVAAGLLRVCAWTGVLAMGCWDAADWSCGTRGSCQVVVLSRWLRTHNKSEQIGLSYAAAAWYRRNERPALPVVPDVRLTSAVAECERVTPLTVMQAVSHVLSWMNLAETAPGLQNELESNSLQGKSCQCYQHSELLFFNYLLSFSLQGSSRAHCLGVHRNKKCSLHFKSTNHFCFLRAFLALIFCDWRF